MSEVALELREPTETHVYSRSGAIFEVWWSVCDAPIRVPKRE